MQSDTLNSKSMLDRPVHLEAVPHPSPTEGQQSQNRPRWPPGGLLVQRHLQVIWERLYIGWVMIDCQKSTLQAPYNLQLQ